MTTRLPHSSQRSSHNRIRFESTRIPHSEALAFRVANHEAPDAAMFSPANPSPGEGAEAIARQD
jgi:hypothetical protein